MKLGDGHMTQPWLILRYHSLDVVIGLGMGSKASQSDIFSRIIIRILGERGFPSPGVAKLGRRKSGRVVPYFHHIKKAGL